MGVFANIASQQQEGGVFKRAAAAQPAPEQPYGKVGGALKDFSQGFAASGIEHLQNVGNMIAKPVGRVFGVPEEQIGIPSKLLERTNTAQKIGAGVETAAEYVAPGMGASKAERYIDTLTQGLGPLTGAVA